eukprot:c9746_g1_i2.p1 GENE.c9746_g1_i2~~c9746_g1_i2.p1  ORF type:complete len:588 (+),score=168.10 c9746_g1_i2:99-1862(+)
MEQLGMSKSDTLTSSSSFSRLNDGPSTDTTTASTTTQQVPTANKPLSVRPISLLIMFTCLGFFLYFDRGVYGALLDDMKDALKLDDLQAGICSSAYLVCYCATGPIFAQVAKFWKPLRLCSIGMIVWVAAVGLSGVSKGFVSLMLARGLTGVGEASFLVMAAPFIDFFAPPAKRSTWLSVFYAAIPVGYASGAAVGAEISAANLFGKNTWRSVYFLEGICVLPCVLLFTAIKGPNSLLEIDPNNDARNVDKSLKGFFEDLGKLINNPLFVFITLGYATQTFFVGGVAVYGIDYLKNGFPLSEAMAGIVFGTVTVFTGLGGSAMGGLTLDYLKPNTHNQYTNTDNSNSISNCNDDKTHNHDHDSRNILKPAANAPSYAHAATTMTAPSITDTPATQLLEQPQQIQHQQQQQLINTTNTATIPPKMDNELIIAQSELAAHKLMVACACIAAPACMGAFVFPRNLAAFLPLLFVGELMGFMLIGPINSATVWCVPISLQPTACAMSTLTIHILGDALSPIVIGAMADKIHIRKSLLFAATSLFLSAMFFVFGFVHCIKRVNAIKKQQECAGSSGGGRGENKHILMYDVGE